ncbi:membrane protein insertion efficiency factor YidD [uncultured Sphaerochaeta sp.]|uniref:membrane protein insertion efficiency factor YidD n=1 Tax=uncultured Sphaerochaeta sp. TaxID=886478 RepID=UPI002A0A5A27|nr:membrane protein insertion efficiency factor YidD [uncultured Sphaerochaeta sp.]
MKKILWLLRQIFLIPVYLYKGILSPFFGGGSCLYHPTCSSYMVDSVIKHGIFKGFIMGFARIIRCSRWFYGGDDPVPDTWSWKAIKDGFTLFRKR